MGYKVINLKDIYNILGEKQTKDVLKNFECKFNKDVDFFLKERAIEFSKQDISRTFIVTSSYKKEDVIVGYFAIANKTTSIKKSILSKTKRKSISKYSEVDAEMKTYNIALPLIGQLGKNYSNGYECFGKRNLEKEEREINSGEYLLQMLRDLSKYSIE